MSSDLPSLDDKGAEHDVSLCVSMGPLASGWQKVQMMTLVSACYRTLSLMDSKWVCVINPLGISACHLTSGVRINGNHLCTDNHSGISAFDLTLRVKMNKNRLCTDNHSGISACRRTHRLWMTKAQKKMLGCACQRARWPLVYKRWRWRC